MRHVRSLTLVRPASLSSAAPLGPLAVLALLAAAAGPPPQCPPVDAAPPADEPGFVSIFNGKDLSGWEGPPGYAVQDGAIVCLPEGRNLYTREQYGDFILRFEFKLAPGANNGIGIRAPRTGDAAFEGMEIQVLDDGAEIYQDLKPWQYHGSVYGVVPASCNAQRAVGQWNSQEIRAEGGRIKVTLNGRVLVEADCAKPGAPESEAPPVLDGRPHLGLRRASGHICFCGHGDRVAFRNLRIKPLGAPVPAAPAAPAAQGSPAAPAAPAAQGSPAAPAAPAAPAGRCEIAVTGYDRTRLPDPPVEAGPATVAGELVFTRVSLDAEGAPLSTVLSRLARATGLNLVPLYSSPAAPGLDPRLPISLYLTNVTALDALEAILAVSGGLNACTWQIRGTLVECGPKALLADPSRRESRVYDITDLTFEVPYFRALGPPIRKVPKEVAADVARMMVNGVEPDAWVAPPPPAPDPASPGSQTPPRVPGPPPIPPTNLDPYSTDDAYVRGRWASLQIRNHRTLVVNAPDFIHRQINGYGPLVPPLPARLPAK